jgi:predicted nucleic acid-binding protein
MRYLLDTNVWIEAVAGEPHAVKALLLAAVDEWCGFSAITRFEILCWPGLSADDERAFLTVLAEFNEVSVSSRVIDEAIRIRKATKLKVPDALIAATALSENASLITRNSTDFKNIAGLQVIDPTTL